MLTDLTPEQRKLADYMSELSEHAYCAGWMDGLEHALWRAMTEGLFSYGRLALTSEHVEQLRLLSTACGGWIRFDPEVEESFVPMAQWIEYYEKAGS